MSSALSCHRFIMKAQLYVPGSKLWLDHFEGLLIIGHMGVNWQLELDCQQRRCSLSIIGAQIRGIKAICSFITLTAINLWRHLKMKSCIPCQKWGLDSSFMWLICQCCWDPLWVTGPFEAALIHLINGGTTSDIKPTSIYFQLSCVSCLRSYLKALWHKVLQTSGPPGEEEWYCGVFRWDVEEFCAIKSKWNWENLTQV